MSYKALSLGVTAAAGALFATPAIAIPVDIIEGDEVVRIEFAGTCDDAYEQYPGRVFACVTLQTVREEDGQDCSGPRCQRPLPKPWKGDAQVQAARPINNQSNSDVVKPTGRVEGWDICNGTYCIPVSKCNESQTRYQSRNGKWHAIPEGYACYKGVLVPKFVAANGRVPIRR